jgi:hypothetical protein
MEDRNTYAEACTHFCQSGFNTFSFCPYSHRANFVKCYTDVHLQPHNIQRCEEALIPPAKDPTATTISEHSTPRRHPAIQHPPPAFTPTPAAPSQQQQPPTDSNASPTENPEQEFLQLLRNLVQCTAAPAPASADSSKAVFPKWDGSDAKKSIFLEQVKLYKLHPTYSAVTDWTKSQPHLPELPISLQGHLFKNLPEKYLHSYVNNSKFDTDGFAMLHDFLTQINHNTSTNKLRTLKTFANLSFPANMEGTEFLSIGRGLAYNMHGFNSYELVAMKMIKCFQEDGRYEGIVKSYRHTHGC